MDQDYIIMWRQKASDVVFPDDVETIRRDLEEGCKQLQGFHCQSWTVLGLHACVESSCPLETGSKLTIGSGRLSFTRNVSRAPECSTRTNVCALR